MTPSTREGGPTDRPADRTPGGGMKMKYVLVTGGVESGLGKGVTASSIGVVLKACGLRVTSIKIDPYLNTDAGTMSPYEHGEVFVLDDGGEVDLDLGNYERFLDLKLTRDNNITTGKIYQSVIDKERRGDYLGQTVQVVPHITDEIQEWIERVAMNPVDGTDEPADVCIIKLGGTIGDIESMPFIEALGQFSYRVGPENFCLVHFSIVPVLSVGGEQKTKPTQHSVRGLRGLGLIPDVLACRSQQPLEEHVKVKLAQFCHIPIPNIINLHDVTNIWHIPLLLRDQKAHEAILKVLDLQCVGQVPREPKLAEWAQRGNRCDRLKTPVRISTVGKYTGPSDSYLSVLKSKPVFKKSSGDPGQSSSNMHPSRFHGKGPVKQHTVPIDTCLHCKKKGHYKKDCPDFLKYCLQNGIPYDPDVYKRRKNHWNY